MSSDPGEQFDVPSSGGADSAAGDEEEASFSPPAEGAQEEAAFTVAPETVAGIPNQILEVRSALEEKLKEFVAGQAAGAASVESFTEAANIQGVGIGLGNPFTGGDPGTPVLTVYTADPASPETVRSILVDSLGVQAASSDADVPIEQVTVGLIEAQPHTFRIRPAFCGVSGGHFRITAGTLGCLALGRTAPRNNRLLCLSNNHVLANSNAGQWFDCIVQPGPYDGGRCPPPEPADRIAVLERFVPINFSGGVNYVDAATGWCWPDRVRRELIYRYGGQLRSFRIGSGIVSPQAGMTVGKSGRTTQLTIGQITAIGVTVRVNYGGGRVALFADQFAVRGTDGTPTFSAGGDSGSVVWRWASGLNPVGLLFAGGGGVTFCNPMYRVLPALDINLYT